MLTTADWLVVIALVVLPLLIALAAVERLRRRDRRGGMVDLRRRGRRC